MKKPFYLLIDGSSLVLPSVGVGVYASRLIQGLLRHAPDLDFKVLLPSEVRPLDCGLPPSRILTFPPSPRFGNDYINGIASQISLTLFLLRQHPEAIFHAPNAFWSPLRPKHTLITFHDLIPHLFPRYYGRYPIRRFMQRLNERFAAGAELILAISHCTARDLTKLAAIPSGKIDVLYNWVGEEFQFFNRATEQVCIEEIRVRYQLPSSYWLYLGGYDYRKNIEFLIHAYAKATAKAREENRETPPPLVLAGIIPTDLSKPYCNVLGAIRGSGLGPDHIILPGRIDAADLPGLYAGASLLIYPSLYEGFGYPPAEAMAVSTPVLVSDSSSLPEVVRNPVCRFDPTNLEDLMEKLLEAVVHPEKFICPLPSEFTERESIQQYLKVLQRLSVT